MMKRCTMCNELKVLCVENFGIRRSSKTGFDSRCKACRKLYDKKRYENNKQRLNEQSKEYYSKNKEIRKEYQKRYYYNHKERCKKSSKNWDFNNEVQRRIINGRSRTRKYGSESVLSRDEWLNIKNYFLNSCAYCGMTESEHIIVFNEKLHHEHLISLIDGGAYSYGNIVPSCRSCNSSKSNKDFNDWYKTSKGYSEERESRILKYLLEME